MNKLLESMKTENNFKLTENGAVALKSTNSYLLDLFGEIGALRNRSDEDIINLYIPAYYENKELSLKTLFYTRDILEGLGERRTFRVLVKYLANNHSDDIKDLIKYIPEYGRWDDLYVFIDTPLHDEALEVIKKQFNEDMINLNAGKDISLLGKWLKSENASSKETKRLGTITREYLNLNSKDYRKALSKLRTAIDVVEKKMSSKKFNEIKYENVPSVAMHRYGHCFRKNDEEGFLNYLNKVKTGEVKINAKTLFPYDLVESYFKVPSYYGCPSSNEFNNKEEINLDEVVEEQWKALPNYLTGNDNFLVMADTSGSMMGRLMATSVGLAIYFAERSNGAFANEFITFTNKPRLVEIPKYATLFDKVKRVMDNKYVGFNTNLEAAFELVLNTAKKNHLSQELMPKAIVVISDMEIDEFGSRDAKKDLSFTQTMKQRFGEIGLTMPTLVYWNVDARQDTFHASINEDVRFVSGSSPTVFKGLCEHLGYSPTELMMNILNSKRYEKIK